jgi:hypothetical protein
MKDHQAIALRQSGAVYHWARFLGGRNSLEMAASVSDAGGERVMVQELPSGKASTVANDLNLSDAIVDAAGKTLAGRDDSGWVLVDLASHTAKRWALANEAWPVAFGPDAHVITRQCDGQGLVLKRVNPQSGAEEFLGKAPFSETAGLAELMTMRLAEDGRTFVYSRLESESTLYVVSGWR